MVVNVIHMTGAPTETGPFSPALAAGPFVFFSGQTGVVPETGELAGDAIEAQTEQSIRNMRDLLESAGLGLEHVVHITIFISSQEHRIGMNEVYMRHFRKPFPTRSTVGVELARPEMLIEMEAIAWSGREQPG